MPRTVAPRKKPSQARSIAKVEKILAAALELLVQDGPEKLTTNHVAKTAGMSVGSLYQYFPNKHAILYELCDRWLSSLRKHLQDYLDDEGTASNSPEKLVDILTHAVFGDWLTNRFNTSGEKALRKAMMLYRDLDQLSDDHAQKQIALITEISARALPHKDPRELQQNATFIYSMDLALETAVELGLPADAALERFKKAVLSLL